MAARPAAAWAPLYHADAFAAAPYTGNPAGVVLVQHTPGWELSEAAMKTIARGEEARGCGAALVVRCASRRCCGLRGHFCF